MANDSVARIVLGGRQSGYIGYMPGILEEAYHSLKSNKPVYLLGGFGGAAKSVIAAINGKQPKELTNDFHYKTEFFKNFKNYSQNKSSVIINYNEITEFLQQFTVEKISAQNGLTVEENEILFESINIHELVFLLIKGLKNAVSDG